jgi:hypothetical protein
MSIKDRFLILAGLELHGPRGMRTAVHEGLDKELQAWMNQVELDAVRIDNLVFLNKTDTICVHQVIPFEEALRKHAAQALGMDIRDITDADVRAFYETRKGAAV